VNQLTLPWPAACRSIGQRPSPYDDVSPADRRGRNGVCPKTSYSRKESPDETLVSVVASMWPVMYRNGRLPIQLPRRLPWRLLPGAVRFVAIVVIVISHVCAQLGQHGAGVCVARSLVGFRFTLEICDTVMTRCPDILWPHDQATTPTRLRRPSWLE